jgi:hypothetical protein
VVEPAQGAAGTSGDVVTAGNHTPPRANPAEQETPRFFEMTVTSTA